LCLGYRAARVVLWSTSAGMKGGASGVFLDAVPHRRDELCGPNHLTWLNGGFGGLTGAQPSTHTHLGSNSWGGGSGLGVLGVRFNPRSVETVGDAAERMPFGVPPSSFGGGESAERGIDCSGCVSSGRMPIVGTAVEPVGSQPFPSNANAVGITAPLPNHYCRCRGCHRVHSP